MSKKQSYYIMIEDGISFGYSTIATTLPESIEQIEVKTGTPAAYLNVPTNTINVMSDEEIVEAYEERQRKEEAGHQYEAKIERLKAEIVALVDDIKFAKEMEHDYAELELDLASKKLEYNNLKL